MLQLSRLARLKLCRLDMPPCSTAALPHLRCLVALMCCLQRAWLARQTGLQSLALSDATVVEAGLVGSLDLTPVLAALRQLTCLALELPEQRCSAAVPALSNLQRLYVDPRVHPASVPLPVVGPSLGGLRWLCAGSVELMQSTHVLGQATSLQQLDVLHVHPAGPQGYASILSDWRALCGCVGALPSLRSLAVFCDSDDADDDDSVFDTTMLYHEELGPPSPPAQHCHQLRHPLG